MAKQTTNEPTKSFDERTSAEAPWAEYQRKRTAEVQEEKDAIREDAPTLSED